MATTAVTTPVDETSLVDQFTRLTADIEQAPHHPSCWLMRAHFLIGKYNELACADAYKAHILCDRTITSKLVSDHNDPGLTDVKLRRYDIMACWLLYVALRELGAVEEAAEYYDRFPDVLLKPQFLPFLISKTSRQGKDRPVLERHRYPWLPNYILRRRVRPATESLRHLHLRIGKASFTDDFQVKGVFAQLDFRKDDIVIEDEIMKVDLEADRAEQDKQTVLLHYTLEYVLKELDRHPNQNYDPLKTQDARNLTVSYGLPAETFSFKNQIVEIADLLSRYNRLFSTTFDYWKLFHMYWQFCTNAVEHTPFDLDSNGNEIPRNPFIGTALYYSYFNHSCAPAAVWTPILIPTTGVNSKWYVRVCANRDIKQDEEIFISYLPPHDLEKPVEERRALLRDWFGADCQCSRCKQEEGLTSAAASILAPSTAPCWPVDVSKRKAISSDNNKSFDEEPLSKKTKTAEGQKKP